MTLNCRAFWRFAVIAIAIVHNVARATSIPFAGEVVEVNEATIRNTEICIIFDGQLEKGVTATIRVPDIVDRRDFKSFLVLVEGPEEQLTAVESAPGSSSGLREVQVSATRFEGKFDNVEVQVIYIAQDLTPLVQILDVNSIFANARASEGKKSAQTKANCK